MNKELLDKIVSLHIEIDNVSKKIEAIKFARTVLLFDSDDEHIDIDDISKDVISFIREKYEANLADLQAELNRYEIVDSVPTTAQPDFFWAKWVTINSGGHIYAHEVLPIKGRIWWHTEPIDMVEEITPEQATKLCGRVPQWEDDEPTPVINK